MLFQSIKCPGCGGLLDIPIEVGGAKCPFCGRHTVLPAVAKKELEEAESRRVHFRHMVHPNLTEDVFREMVADYIIKDLDAPDELLDGLQEKSLQVCYIPVRYNTFDFNTAWSAEIGETEEYFDGSNTCTRTKYRTHTGVNSNSATFPTVLSKLMVSKGLDLKMESMLLDIPFSMAKPFNLDDVEGKVWLSCDRDINEIDESKKRDDLPLYVQRYCEELVNDQHDDVRHVSSTLNITFSKQEVALVPFFFFEFEYNDNSYTIFADAVNLQIAGALPRSTQRKKNYAKIKSATYLPLLLSSLAIFIIYMGYSFLISKESLKSLGMFSVPFYFYMMITIVALIVGIVITHAICKSRYNSVVKKMRENFKGKTPEIREGMIKDLRSYEGGIRYRYSMVYLIVGGGFALLSLIVGGCEVASINSELNRLEKGRLLARSLEEDINATEPLAKEVEKLADNIKSQLSELRNSRISESEATQIKEELATNQKAYDEKLKILTDSEKCIAVKQEVVYALVIKYSRSVFKKTSKGEIPNYTPLAKRRVATVQSSTAIASTVVNSDLARLEREQKVLNTELRKNERAVTRVENDIERLEKREAKAKETLEKADDLLKNYRSSISLSASKAKANARKIERQEKTVAKAKEAYGKIQSDLLEKRFELKNLKTEGERIQAGISQKTEAMTLKMEELKN